MLRRFRYADPEELRNHLDGVAKIAGMVNESDLPDRVTLALEKKRAHLFVTTDDQGFIVVTFSGSRLLVWLAHLQAKGGWSPYFDDFEQLARDIGASGVMFLTMRPGFKKMMPALGYGSEPDPAQPKYTRWSKDLETEDERR